MAKRQRKTTKIVVSKAPRRDLAVLTSPPPVTMADYRADSVAFREMHRAMFADALREDFATLAAMRTDVQDAGRQMTAAVG